MLYPPLRHDVDFLRRLCGDPLLTFDEAVAGVVLDRGDKANGAAFPSLYISGTEGKEGTEDGADRESQAGNRLTRA